VEFRILGPLEVVQGEQVSSLPRGRGRALLALLILHAGQVVSTDRLIDELWGEQPPPTATTALQGLVSHLRKRLEPARADRQAPVLLQTVAPGYVLAVDRNQVDANRFRRLVEEAAETPAAEKAARLRTALGLWRGRALADFTYQPFAQTEITALEELRITSLEERIDADLTLGHLGGLVAELEALVAEHPLRERLHGQLMLALYREGRQADALEVYRHIRQTLVEELGIDPGPALQRLEGAILRQDSSLEFLPPAQSEGSRQPDEAADRSWLPPGRKTVTVVFVDLAPTDMGANSDPETRRRIIAQGYDTATGALTGHGGTVEGLIGDVVVAVFGVPTSHEDDAWRAVRAAVELRRELTGLNEWLQGEWGTDLAARVGIETGEVVVGRLGPGGPSASGDAVNVAARLQQAAGVEEILVGEATRRVLGDAALVEPVETSATDITAWRLTDLVPDAPAVGGVHAPMVGRDAELAQLRTLFDLTVRNQQAALVAVLGEAGVGKSRLARELASVAGSEALVLTGRCPAYGEGISFWPLREIVLQAIVETGTDDIADLLGGDDEAESIAAQVAGAIGLTGQVVRPQGLFPAIRGLFETLARKQPLVLVFEDVHWAQSTLLDLIDYLTESITEPVMVLCLARPEFLDQRHAWTENRDNATSLVLSPLGPDDTEQLIADRLAGRALPPAAAKRVLDTAQGNPLFVEQLVAALLDQTELSIPPSLQSLLAARLDRLGPAERDLLRCASVAGIEFSLEALVALVPTEGRPFVGRHLQVLQERKLIYSTDRWLLGRTAFSFRHVLIQQAAYRSISRQVRSELHERVARWLESEKGPSSVEFDEIIGYNLEQACLDRRHLGIADEHTYALAVEAGERLADAGLRAFARFDAAAAENLLTRATSLLPSTHARRSEVKSRLAEAYTVMGRHHDADALLAGLREETGAYDARLERFIRVERARIRMATGPDPTSLEAIRQEANQILAGSEQAGDQAGMAQALFLLALVHQRLGELRLMEKVARRGIACADRSGSAREEMGARLVLALALEAGPTPVPECIPMLEELVRWRQTEHPSLLSTLAHLQAMLGRFNEAQELIDRARRLLVEQTRARRPLGLLSQQHAEVEILAGDLPAAERHLRAGLDLNLDMKEREPITQISASLSRILSLRGDHEEAARLAFLSRDNAPAESVAAQALWRTAMARVAATRRNPRDAVRLAGEAVDLIPPSMINLGAGLRLDLAEILLATGRDESARSVTDDAAKLYERKGNLVGGVRAGRLRT
jgi:DNA-binding SARP family transcriptional activator/tetratricopeptide (TPR) repeat protein